MARRTATGNANVLEARHLEAGRTYVTSVASADCLDMIIRLGCSRNTATSRMAAGTFLRCIFKDAIHVALFTAQGGMNIPQ